MRIAVILLSGLTLALSKPSAAPYIHQAGRPLNIAHRGICSILPKNSLQAFEAVLYQGADFIELDLVYTKNKEFLVMLIPSWQESRKSVKSKSLRPDKIEENMRANTKQIGEPITSLSTN